MRGIGMKLKCSHCNSENTTIDIIHTSLVANEINTYNRIDRESSETHTNHKNDLTTEYVVITVKCSVCDLHTDYFARDDGNKVEFKNE